MAPNAGPTNLTSGLPTTGAAVWRVPDETGLIEFLAEHLAEAGDNKNFTPKTSSQNAGALPQWWHCLQWAQGWEHLQQNSLFPSDRIWKSMTLKETVWLVPQFEGLCFRFFVFGLWHFYRAQQVSGHFEKHDLDGSNVRKDFSIICSEQMKKDYLLLGPARFVNASCVLLYHSVLMESGRYSHIKDLKSTAREVDVGVMANING
ncbi:hypothetical protein B0H14DRAFT_2626069 [Mycena olivaceomarginata]|nr:hypothetical protein B0H14DRAFT_2626069 [Mycena olivaceomarginata]